MILGQLHLCTDTRDIDHTGSISLDICTSFCQETQECGSDVVDGEGVDFVEGCPAVGTIVVEEGVAECFWVFVFRGLGIVKPSGAWTYGTSAEYSDPRKYLFKRSLNG